MRREILVSSKFKKFYIIEDWFGFRLLFSWLKSSFFLDLISELLNKREVNFKKQFSYKHKNYYNSDYRSFFFLEKPGFLKFKKNFFIDQLADVLSPDAIFLKEYIYYKYLNNYIKRIVCLSYLFKKKKRQWSVSRSPYSFEYYKRRKFWVYNKRISRIFRPSYFKDFGIRKNLYSSLKKYKKLFNSNLLVFNPNKKSRSIKLRTFEHEIFSFNTYSYFSTEMIIFFRELSNKIFFSNRLKKKLFTEKKFFFIKIKVESKYNSIIFSNGFQKFILRKTTKSLGIKTRKMRRDIIKTKFLFQKIFYLFKKFMKSKFKVRDFYNYSFIFSLQGDVIKTSKIFKYIISNSKCKLFSILDETAVPHNGCRAPKRRRKKNKGRNKYVKKLRSN